MPSSAFKAAPGSLPKSFQSKNVFPLYRFVMYFPLNIQYYGAAVRQHPCQSARKHKCGGKFLNSVRRRTVTGSASFWIGKRKYGEPRHKGGAAKFELVCSWRRREFGAFVEAAI